MLDNRENLREYTLLLVDDEDDIVAMFSRILKRYFREIYTAHDGLEGIEQYILHRPSIVVSDVTMPRCDGVEMAQRLHERDEHLHIVFATGHNEDNYQTTFAPFGGYTVTKPIDIQTLLTTIDACLHETHNP